MRDYLNDMARVGGQYAGGGVYTTSSAGWCLGCGGDGETDCPDCDGEGCGRCRYVGMVPCFECLDD